MNTDAFKAMLAEQLQWGNLNTEAYRVILRAVEQQERSVTNVADTLVRAGETPEDARRMAQESVARQAAVRSKRFSREELIEAARQVRDGPIRGEPHVVSEPAAVRSDTERDELRAAAQAVIERWDTPLWKDVPATANYINRLRAALGSTPQPQGEREAWAEHMELRDKAWEAAGQRVRDEDNGLRASTPSTAARGIRPSERIAKLEQDPERKAALDRARERIKATKSEPGSEMHLTVLMAPYSLNFFCGQDRQHLLAWGRDVWNAARASLSASPSAVSAEARVQINLREEQAKLLGEFLTASDEPPEVVLSIGNGHSGHGLYVWEAEYPEEGATFIAAMGTPPADAPQPESAFPTPEETRKRMAKALRRSADKENG